MGGNVLSDAAVQELRRMRRDLYAELRQELQRPGGRTEQQRVMGVLDGDLDAAADKSNSPATATVSVWALNSSGNLADTGDNITVTNRFENIAIESGTLVKCEFILNEWQLYAADCEA